MVFKMSPVLQLEFSKKRIFKRPVGLISEYYVTMSNCVEIGRNIAVVRQFNCFSKRFLKTAAVVCCVDSTSPEVAKSVSQPVSQNWSTAV